MHLPVRVTKENEIVYTGWNEALLTKQSFNSGCWSHGQQVSPETSNQCARPSHALAKGPCPLPRKDRYGSGVGQWHIFICLKRKQNNIHSAWKRKDVFAQSDKPSTFYVASLSQMWKWSRPKAHPYAAKWNQNIVYVRLPLPTRANRFFLLI